MMQLGGNITLEGFEGVEPGKLVVVKKIVGSYARKISDSVSGFEKLDVTLIGSEGDFEAGAVVSASGKATKKTVKDKNMFFALDRALAQVESSLK